MELDKRIEALTDILSVTVGCHDWELMTKKGYFANSIFDFKDLKRLCAYGEYAGWREHNQCFLCKQAGDETYYSYFLPEDRLLPEEPEKKYRPYTLAEWIDQHEIGEVIHFRDKDYKQQFNVMYAGYIIDSGEDIQDIRTVGRIVFMYTGYFLEELFKDYEICINGEWQPFGIIDESQE